MTGTLYGVGLGPGDPDLITRKAARLIETAAVIAYPTLAGGKSFARQIAQDLIRDDTFDVVVNYDAPGMGRDAWTSIMIALQNGGGGNLQTQVFSPTYVTTKDNVDKAECWDPEKYASRLR